jgi:hypothetical protein
MHSPNTDAWPTFAHVCDCRVPFALLANRPKVATGLTRARVTHQPAPPALWVLSGHPTTRGRPGHRSHVRHTPSRPLRFRKSLKCKDLQQQ